MIALDTAPSYPPIIHYIKAHPEFGPKIRPILDAIIQGETVRLRTDWLQQTRQDFSKRTVWRGCNKRYGVHGRAGTGRQLKCDPNGECWSVQRHLACTRAVDAGKRQG
jgi:hypothetical protein